MIFPPGEWSFLLVGDQWPDDQDLMALSNGKVNRGQIKTGFAHFADMLRNAQTGPLAEQQGYTADDLRNAFRQGENQARQVAEKNGVKESAYGTAYDSMVSLQHDLTDLANEGNQRIKEIQDSKEPIEAQVPQIVASIQQYRALANIAAAKYSGNVFDAMQRILDEEGTGQSARQFAQTHGVDVGNMFRQPEDQEALADAVKNKLNDSAPPPALASGGGTSGIQGAVGAPPPGPQAMAPSAFSSGGRLPARVQSAGGTPPPPPHAAAPAPPAFASAGELPPGLSPAGTGPAPPTPIPASASGLSAPAHGLAGPSAPQLPTTPQPTTTSFAGSPLTPTGPTQAATPGELMHSFDKGLQGGAPFSNAAGAVPPALMAPADPTAAATTPSAGMGAAVNPPAFDSPAPVAHAPTPDATPPPQMVAGPAAPVAAPPPSGPLPAYASDLRPPISAATTPAAPPSPPPSAMPGSGPVHPSAGQGSPAQPMVMRRETSPVPPSSPSSLGTQAVAATATGAVAGAASANATARARLQRLVSAVARQQPRLAWAAGDRPDNTTVLATDLASGWIPPGIDLPSAVKLLPPERRRGDLETLLGEVSVAAGYTPIHHIPEDDEPVVTSPRPRRVPDIDEIGWELNQATQWRDGLPRLAHTLAKAASAGTGVPDKEVDQLREHLGTISARVLDSYPDHVDSQDIGNWQLLAAIDALVVGDKTAANYHLAWFKACSTTTTAQTLH
jgi:hypothetical protein